MLAATIRLVHVLLVAFLLVAPWCPRREVRQAHACLVPAILLHWVANSQRCGLTQLEAHLRGEDPSRTFMQGVLGPVFDRRRASGLSVAGLLALWTVSAPSL